MSSVSTRIVHPLLRRTPSLVSGFRRNRSRSSVRQNHQSSGTNERTGSSEASNKLRTLLVKLGFGHSHPAEKRPALKGPNASYVKAATIHQGVGTIDLCQHLIFGPQRYSDHQIVKGPAIGELDDDALVHGFS